MKISAYLAHLSQPNVSELVLTSGHRPMAVVSGETLAFGNEDLAEEGLLSALFALGGSRYLDTLAERPALWTASAPPVGTVSISAKRTGPNLEVRLSLLRPAKRVTDDETAASSGTRDVQSPGRSPHAAPATRAATTLPRDSRDEPSDPKSSSRLEPRSPANSRTELIATPPRRDPRFESDSPPKPAATASLHKSDGGVEARRDSKTEPQRAVKSEPRRDVKSEPRPIPIPAMTPKPEDSTASMQEPRISARLEVKSEPRIDPKREPTLRSVGGPPRPPELETLLRAAADCHASDLHLVAGRPPLFRVAFELVAKGDPLSEGLVEKMALSSVPARLRLALDSDGSADFALDEPAIGRFRVNVSKQRTGYKISLRIVPRAIPTLASLGLPSAISLATQHHQGLIVVTGPTGHGKTSTLAAIVDILNTERAHHVITVEDPIEYVHPPKKAIMSQREVGTDTQSFLSALKGSLREDPDVIVVGELRDVETVRMAVAASETGHLVLGTMNTPNAAKAIERLIDLFPPADQAQIRLTLASGLRLVVGQRLVPSVDKKALHAAVELLPGSMSLSALIRDNRTFQIPSLQQRGKGLGILRLDESLIELVKEGKISLEVARSVAEAPQELEAACGFKAPAEPQKKTEGFLGSLFGKKG